MANLPTEIVPGVTTGHADDHEVINDVVNRTVTTDGTQTITGQKAFSTNPVFNTNAIPQSKVESLTSDLATKATDSAVVHLAGTEVVTGQKTFSTDPVFNDSAIPQAKVSGLTTSLNGKVGTTGNETIAGTKTFSSAPSVPDASFPVAKLSNPSTLLYDAWGVMPVNRISANGVWTSRSAFLAAQASLVGYTGPVEWNSETYANASDPANAGATNGDFWERKKPT